MAEEEMMENFEEDGSLPPFSEDPASPIPQRRLKRLKKASEARVPDPPPTETLDSDLPSTATLGLDPSISSSPASVSVPEVACDTADVVGSLSESVSDGKELDFDDGLDPLFVAPREMGKEKEEEQNAYGMESFDSIGKTEGTGMGGLIEELRKGKSAKKRLNLDGEQEEMTEVKKKKSRSKSGDMDGTKPKESSREKKRLGKERKAYLDQIHVESQRLLRETRDATFKPAPLVQKPISSVLGKIRLRKLELMQKLNSQTDSSSEADYAVGEIAQVPNPSGSQKVMEDEIHEKVDGGSHSAVAKTCGNSLDQCENVVGNEDISSDLQNSDENNLINNSAYNTIDKALSPSVPPSSPKHDHLTDVSSSEEDNDKENIDPCTRKAVSMDPYPEDGAVKAFVDDEAEEEDDSDHDIIRFGENEEDDSDENEELKDMIATGFQEGSVDHEKRNELHQKWLEQQDAAEMVNVLQRFKCGQKPKDPRIEDEEDDEGSGNDSEHETSYDLSPRNTIRQNTIKAKQMIVQMFTDDHDIYVPSDDEEAENILVRHRLSEQTEDSSFKTPIDDEHSREVFGLIKKLNSAPQPKKRGKVATSKFEMQMIGGNSNNASKSSFIGRTTSGSLASSHKSVTSRTFIFGRDDSNSKSAISSPDNLPDMVQMDNNQPRKTSSSRITSSQLKSAPSRTESQEDAVSGSSLFEILRRSSVSFDKKLDYKSGSSNNLIRETQIAHQFSAFKSGRKFSKVQARD